MTVGNRLGSLPQAAQRARWAGANAANLCIGN